MSSACFKSSCVVRLFNVTVDASIRLRRHVTVDDRPALCSCKELHGTAAECSQSKSYEFSDTVDTLASKGTLPANFVIGTLAMVRTPDA